MSDAVKVPDGWQVYGGHFTTARSETAGTEMRVPISCESANQIIAALEAVVERVTAPVNDKQLAVDVSNLRFYARLFKEHHWEDPVIHWGVFHQTLLEIADRISAMEAENARLRMEIEADDGL